jgi:hypothetical protein
MSQVTDFTVGLGGCLICFVIVVYLYCIAFMYNGKKNSWRVLQLKENLSSKVFSKNSDEIEKSVHSDIKTVAPVDLEANSSNYCTFEINPLHVIETNMETGMSVEDADITPNNISPRDSNVNEVSLAIENILVCNSVGHLKDSTLRMSVIRLDLSHQLLNEENINFLG